MTFSVKGGFWGDISSTYAPISSVPSALRRLARILNVNGMRKEKELMLTLNGATAGSAASATYKRVDDRENSAGEVGGLRTIETVTAVSANTTSDDKTFIDDNILAFVDAPSSYPANGDGNPRDID